MKFSKAETHIANTSHAPGSKLGNVLPSGRLRCTSLFLEGGSGKQNGNLPISRERSSSANFRYYRPSRTNITPDKIKNKTLKAADMYERRIPYRRDGIRRKYLLR